MFPDNHSYSKKFIKIIVNRADNADTSEFDKTSKPMFVTTGGSYEVNRTR